MQVQEYIHEVLSRPSQLNDFPRRLVLPDRLVVAFSALFVAGEREGREYGCNLTYEEQTGELIQSQRYVGDSNSCPIRPMAHWENCADVHCHPADSIGDVGGYSPHSMEDFLSFSDQLHKPLFIRFVVSHDRVYAAVYRKGYTRYDAGGIYDVNGELREAIDGYFEEFCPVGQEERNDALVQAQLRALDRGEDGNQATARLMIEYKRRTPGLGEHTADATMRACRKVASRFRFGFYERDGTYGLVRLE